MPYSVEVFNLGTLSLKEREACSFFIPLQYRSCLDGIDPFHISYAKIVAVGLKYNNELVGLILAADYEGISLATLFSIKIDEAHQDLVLARQMLQKVESSVILSGAVIINFFFRKKDSDSSFIEAVLNESKWARPEIHSMRYFFDCYTFQPKWYQQPPKLSKKYKIFPWKKLKKEERKQLEFEYEQGRYSNTVYPFGEEETLDFINSLGLRYNGRVIGWMLTHRLAPDMIKYGALYVSPEFQFSGSAVRLLADSIKLQQRSSIRWSLFEVVFGQSPSSWIKFVEKRLAPYSIGVDQIFQSWKALTPDAYLF